MTGGRGSGFQAWICWGVLRVTDHAVVEASWRLGKAVETAGPSALLPHQAEAPVLMKPSWSSSVAL